MTARIGVSAALALLLALAPAAAFAQIPNAGFETWAGGSPVGWITDNSPPLVSPVTQTSVAHSGSSAVRGDVVPYFTINLQPLLQSGPLGHGFAFSQRPANFTGWYQFHTVGGDQLVINVFLYSGGYAGTPVAIAATVLTTEVTSYTQFSAPFSYLSTLAPDTCVVQVQIVGSAGSNYHAGSYFLLDDLAMSGTNRFVPGSEGDCQLGRDSYPDSPPPAPWVPSHQTDSPGTTAP